MTNTPPTLADLKAAYNKMEAAGLVPTGPGPDLLISQDIHEALQERLATADSMPAFCGLRVEVNRFLGAGTMLGVTAAGRAVVKKLQEDSDDQEAN